MRLQRLINGQLTLKIAPSSGEYQLYIIHGSLGLHKQTIKLHLDWFSQSAGLMNVANRKRDTQAEYTCSNRLQLAIAVMQPNN